jgi:fused signal recognition particle receptor
MSSGKTGRGLLGRLFGREREKVAEVAPGPAPDAVVEPASSPPPSAPDLATRRVADEPAPEPAKGGWLSRLKSGLARTSSKLGGGVVALFTKRKLDAATLEELEDLLIEADLGVETSSRIVATLKSRRHEKGISADEVREILASEIAGTLEPIARPLPDPLGRKPHVILVVGVNGTGKTTTIGKIAHRYRQQGKSVLLAAGDTFRAAAIDQLKIWGARTGSAVVARDVGSDAASLAFEALTAAREQGTDVVLIDTAGRLQNKAGLMAELEKVARVIKKIDPSAPHDVLLVLDATTGQNALNQVEVFRDKIGVTGLVMTKLDGTARGGILVAIAARFGLPVHAIGVGEGVDDLQPFDAGEFARAIALG